MEERIIKIMRKKLKVWLSLCAVGCAFTPAAFCMKLKEGGNQPPKDKPPVSNPDVRNSAPVIGPANDHEHDDVDFATGEPGSTSEYMQRLKSGEKVVSSKNVRLGRKELVEISEYIKKQDSTKRDDIFNRVIPQILYQFKYDPDGSDMIVENLMKKGPEFCSGFNKRMYQFAYIAKDGRGVCRDAASYLDFIAELFGYEETDRAILEVAPEGPYARHAVNMIKLGDQWWVYDLTVVGYPQKLETFIERVAPGPWRKPDRLCVYQWIKCGDENVDRTTKGDVFNFAFGKFNPHIAWNTMELRNENDGSSTLVIGKGLTEIDSEYIAHVEKYIRDSKWEELNGGEKKRSNIKIKTIELDPGVKIMHPFTFAYSDRIENLDISRSKITNIPECAFCGSKIKSIKFNKDTNNIGKYAFSGMFTKDCTPDLINFYDSPFAKRLELTKDDLLRRGNIPGGICAQYNVDCFESQDLISSLDDINKIKSTVGIDSKTGRTVIGKNLMDYRADEENTLDLKYIRTLLLLGIIDKDSNITISSDVEKIEDGTFNDFSCGALDMSRLASETQLSSCLGVFNKNTNIKCLILPNEDIVKGHLGFNNGVCEGDNVVIGKIQGPLHSFHLLQPSYWREVREFEITDIGRAVKFGIQDSTLTIEAPDQEGGATYGPSHYLALWHWLSLNQQYRGELDKVTNVEFKGPWLAEDGGSSFYVLDKKVNNVAFMGKTLGSDLSGDYITRLPQIWTTDGENPRKNITLKTDLSYGHWYWYDLPNTPNVILQSNGKSPEDRSAAVWDDKNGWLEMTPVIPALSMRSIYIDEAVAAARGLNKKVDAVYVHDTNLEYDYKACGRPPIENDILSSTEFAMSLITLPACPNLVQNIVVGSNTKISVDEAIMRERRTGKGMGFFKEQNVLFKENSNPSWNSVKACFDCGMNVFMHPDALGAMQNQNSNSRGKIPKRYLARIKGEGEFPFKKA